MKKILLFSTGFLMVSAIIFGQNKEEKELIIRVIQVNDKKLETFIKQENTDSIAKIFSPNCHFMPEYGEILEDREAVSKYLTVLFKSGFKIVDFDMNPIEHRVYGQIVLELGTMDITYSLPSESKEVKTKYNYLINWKASKKGNYRIRVATWNSVKKS